MGARDNTIVDVVSAYRRRVAAERHVARIGSCQRYLVLLMLKVLTKVMHDPTDLAKCQAFNLIIQHDGWFMVTMPLQHADLVVLSLDVKRLRVHCLCESYHGFLVAQ